MFAIAFKSNEKLSYTWRVFYMKKIIYIILLMMGICSYLTNATWYSLTKYYFDGLSPTTNKIEGNTDPLNYPIITFPSK